MTTLSHPAHDLGHWFVGTVQWWSRQRAAAKAPLTLDPGAANVSLEKDQFHVLMSLKGGTIECVDGCVWLTHDGDCRDVVLEASQRHVVDRDSRLTIYAIASSAICRVQSRNASPAGGAAARPLERQG